MSDNERQPFFELFGELAVLFSNMEAQTTQVLETLVNQHNPLIAGILTNNLSLSRKLSYIRELARFRFCNNNSMKDRIVATISKVSNFCCDRNRFIHGTWIMDKKMLANQRVRCSNPQWIIKEGHWHRMQNKEYGFEDFRGHIREVGKIIHELLQLTQDSSKANMVEISKDVNYPLITSIKVNKAPMEKRN